MQLQGLLAGNRTRVLWIIRPVLYHWATEAVSDEFSIYVNEMVMQVKDKGILIIIFGIYTRCQ